MKKSPKGASARKPPAPSTSHDEVAAWISQVMPALHPIVEYLDGLIRKEIPKAVSAVKWKRAFYGVPTRGWVIELVSYDVSVNVVFHAGGAFDPPPPLGEGDSRYVKLRSLEDAKQPQLRQWIREAGRHAGLAFPTGD